MSDLPKLPVEFDASRAEFKDSFWIVLISLFICLPLSMLVVYKLLPLHIDLPEDTIRAIEAAFFPVLIIGAVMISPLQRRYHQNISEQTATRLSKDGIEYVGPNSNITASWSDIESVSWEPTNEDDPPSTIVLKTASDKFKLSANYFTDEEIHVMARLIKDHCPAAQKNEAFKI